MNKVEKQQKELKRLKSSNNFLVIALFLLIICILLLCVKIENLEEEKEDLCFISNKAISILNQFAEVYDFELSVKEINCYSGDAERRLEDE